MRHIIDHFQNCHAPDRTVLKEIFGLCAHDRESLRPSLDGTACFEKNPFLEVLFSGFGGVDLVYVNMFLDLKEFVEGNRGFLPDPLPQDEEIEYEDMGQGQRLRRWMNAYLSKGSQMDYRKRKHLADYCKGRTSRAERLADAEAFEKYRAQKAEEARKSVSSPEGMESAIREGLERLFSKGYVSGEDLESVIKAEGLAKVQSAARTALENALRADFDGLKDDLDFFDVASCVDRKLFMRILSWSSLGVGELNRTVEKLKAIQRELLSERDFRQSLRKSGLKGKLEALDEDLFSLFERVFSHEARTARHRLAKGFILDKLRFARAS